MAIVRGDIDRAEVVVEHRRAMFRDIWHSDEALLDRMAARFRPWLLAKMNAGEYLAWFAVDDDGTIAGGAGLWLMDWPPHVIGGGAVRGNIVNVYTQPQFRRRGIARSLVAAAVDWCRENGIDCVILHASAEGRALYESMGFRSTNEMRLLL